jgi:hypothetical protein
VRVPGDSGAAARRLEQLLDNAVKFSAHEAATGRSVSPASTAGGRDIVRDNGVGFDYASPRGCSDRFSVFISTSSFGVSRFGTRWRGERGRDLGRGRHPKRARRCD